MAWQGGCDCGAVRYTLSRDDFPAVICCHCLDCQTRSGSAFELTAFVPAVELKVTGPLLTVAKKGKPSGLDMKDSFCGNCQTGIYNTHAGQPGMFLLRAGTLDESQSIVPAAHIFTKRMQRWIVLPRDVPAFDEFPPPVFFESASQGQPGRF